MKLENLKLEHLKKGLVIALEHKEICMQAEITEIDFDCKPASLDDESKKAGNVVIGLIVLFSEEFCSIFGKYRTLVLEKNKENELFVWIKFSSSLSGMPNTFRYNIMTK